MTRQSGWLSRFHWFALATALVLAVAACGGGYATVSEPDESNGEGVASSSPQDKLRGDLSGAGWVKVDAWPVAPEAGAATSCPEFDAIVLGVGNVWNEALWTKGEARLSHRVADVGPDAGPLVETAGTVSTACPSVELGGTEVTVSPLSLSLDDGFELSAFPIPNRGTAGLLPKLDAGSQAWVIVLQHDNTVSVLTIEDDGSLDGTEVESIAALAVETMVSAATTEPQRPSADPGSATSAVLSFDSEECRNRGTVEAFGVVWDLVDAVPFAWQGMSPKQGTLTIVDDENATFAAADGTELRVSIGPFEHDCFGWDDEG